MSRLDALLEQMAHLIGISPTYTDAFGRSVETSHETRLALLAGLGLGVATENEAQESLARLERLKFGVIPAVIAIDADKPAQIQLRDTPGPLDWRLIREDGSIQEGMLAVGATALELPALPMGYHRLRIGDVEATLIAAPTHCWKPEPLERGARLWGLTAQIYSLRSERDLGIGDFSDAALAAEGVGTFGGAFLGLSPAHALFSADRTKISPYSPSSRLFLEPLYIDPTAERAFVESGAARLLGDPAMQERLERLHNAQFIDYAEAWALKRPLLDALWGHFRSSGEHSAFDAFRRSGGEALEAHATFEALSEHFREQGCSWLGEWPEGFRDVRSTDIRRFRAEQGERIDFHAWLQWLADCQMAKAAERARAAGLTIGIYRDLAVGADGGGSEIWATPERFAPMLSVGAPPDPLGPQGQDWGLPPFNPLTLEEQGLAAFRDLVSANMRHAGAIRIDHAFQLRRLFLIPSGAPASQGAYVDYPFEAMLAVLRVESHRARCLVIAEDLGTAPEGFSDAIMASGVLSYRVLPFERESATFKKPERYPRSALAVITTHDLPTFAGWWRGLDIDLRQTLGVFPPRMAENKRASRAADRQHFAQVLADEGILPSPQAPEEPPLEGAVRYLARTASILTSLQIEDASGELNQPNMPGMDAGHPNWRRRLSNPVESITAPGSLLAKLAVIMAEEGRDVRSRRSVLASPPPRATYRLQFHKDFTFDNAVKIVPYLAELGISHIYSSPIHAARPGSTHGYDIVSHTAINPELGGEDGFRRLSEALRTHGLGLILDIVPNHMGVGGQDNGWWLSVLEWGRLSPFADAFDIDWERLGAQGKLIVPFIGDLYGLALEKGDLKLNFDETEGSFSVWHWEHRFPICPTTYPIILAHALAALADPAKSEDLAALAERFQSLGKQTSLERGVPLSEEADMLKCQLAEAVSKQPALKEAVDKAVTTINGSPGVPGSFNILHDILEAQAYRLTYWRAASDDINYRRFFDVNNLAGVRVEIGDIFERTHELVLRLAKEDLIQGFRIDHIDGLADPEMYARALQDKVGPGFYVVVEKILEPGEELRPWPVAGTTGYDALNLIDGVLVDFRAGDELERIYREASGLQGSYDDLLREAKVGITQTSFASELEVLSSDIKKIADADRRTRDYTFYALQRALVDIIASFPVYRTYLGEGEPDPEDMRLIQTSVEKAKQLSPLPDHTVHDFIVSALLGQIDAADAADLRRFRRRFQQLTGPVMAKSLEDTLFYRYGRLIALNEVGGDPGHFGLAPEAFHEANIARARAWPHTMIATATHDTKRGEDARARLLALSEMPDEWAKALDLWREIVAPYLSRIENAVAPDANDQVILIQALLGGWPLELLDSADPSQFASFEERVKQYVTKALREAKRYSSWINPNEAYEGATLKLLKGLLDPNGRFIEHFRPLVRRLSFLGMLNGLSRTILKATIPGMPDTYQGTELWDFSFVDPDNRRPVDYEWRRQALERREPLEEMIAHWRDGPIKQHVLSRLLLDRNKSPALYAEGDYRPLDVSGERAPHLLVFAREYRGNALVVIVPRLWAGLSEDYVLPLDGGIWGDTAVVMPRGRWRNVMTNEDIVVENDRQRVGDLLASLPFAVLRRQGGVNEQQ